MEHDEKNRENLHIKEVLKETKAHIGKTLLTDEQILILACESISRTFTHEEKKYHL